MSGRRGQLCRSWICLITQFGRSRCSGSSSTCLGRSEMRSFHARSYSRMTCWVSFALRTRKRGSAYSMTRLLSLTWTSPPGANRRRLVNVFFLYYIRNNFRSCAVALHARALQVCLAMTTFCTLRKFDENSLPKRQMFTSKFTKTTLWLFPLWQVRSTNFRLTSSLILYQVLAIRYRDLPVASAFSSS